MSKSLANHCILTPYELCNQDCYLDEIWVTNNSVEFDHLKKYIFPTLHVISVSNSFEQMTKRDR